MTNYRFEESKLLNLVSEEKCFYNKKEHFLVYKITNKVNGMIYVGVHGTENINDKYMGSGREILKAIKNEGLDNFIKTILFEYNNEKDMLNKEAEIVNDKFIARTDTYNIVLGGNSYTRKGCATVKDKNGNVFLIHKTDPRYLSGEFVGINKNMVTVKDKENNKLQVSINDPRYISKELIPFRKGCIIPEERKKRIALNNAHKGKCWVYSLSLKENKRIIKKELKEHLSKGWIKGRKYRFYNSLEEEKLAKKAKHEIWFNANKDEIRRKRREYKLKKKLENSTK